MRWIKPMISGRWCKVVRIFAKLSNGIDSDKVSSVNFRHLASRLSLNQVMRHYHLVLLVVLGFVPSSCCIFLWKLLKHYVTVDSISTWVTDYSPGVLLKIQNVIWLMGENHIGYRIAFRRYRRKFWWITIIFAISGEFAGANLCESLIFSP